MSEAARNDGGVREQTALSSKTSSCFPLHFLFGSRGDSRQLPTKELEKPRGSTLRVSAEAGQNSGRPSDSIVKQRGPLSTGLGGETRWVQSRPFSRFETARRRRRRRRSFERCRQSDNAATLNARECPPSSDGSSREEL